MEDGASRRHRQQATLATKWRWLRDGDGRWRKVIEIEPGAVHLKGLRVVEGRGRLEVRGVHVQVGRKQEPLVSPERRAFHVRRLT